MNALSRCLRGPNVWASCPVIEIALELRDAAAWTPDRLRSTRNSFMADVLGEDPGPVPLGLARAFARTVLQLQELAGSPASFWAVRATARPGQALAAVGYADEAVGLAAVEATLRLFRAAAEGREIAQQEEVDRLKKLEYRRRLPVSTAVIYHAARARGIPVARLSPEYQRYLRLGQGSKQHRFRACEPDTASAVARLASTDKHLAKQLLAAAGVPVPEGRLATTVEEAWAAAQELGLPVAVKPVDADLAVGVSLDLRTREQVEAAFNEAARHGDEVLVERFAPGLEHRVLVVGERVVAVTRIEPPHVVGDGRSTVAELAERVNRDPRRGDEGSGTPLARLLLDDVAREVLAGQGLTLESVPPAGARVLLRRNPPYIRNGGSLSDLTDHVHPSVVAHAVAAAQAVQLPVAGLDVVALDIARPLEEQGGVVVEINTSPGLWLHLAPWADSPRPVGRDIVDHLFPSPDGGRIPVVGVVGDDSRDATRNLVALLGLAGIRAGCAGPAGVILGGRRWDPPAGTPQERAEVLFQNPVVDAAILRTTPAELVGDGFGNDRCDVALVLSPAWAAGSAADGADADEHLLAVRHALGSDGVLVLAAADAARAASFPAARLILLATAMTPHLRAHLAAGGRALLADGAITLLWGSEAPVVLGPYPPGLGDRETLGLLAALAAGLALAPRVIEGYLEAMATRPDQAERASRIASATPAGSPSRISASSTVQASGPTSK